MQHISLFAIVVTDYDEAIDFYVNKLGFELREDTAQGDKRWVVVAPDGAGAGVLLALATNEAQVARVGDQTGGRVGFFLQTDDFATLYRRMLDADVRFLEHPRYEPYGTVAVFEDLYGNRWDLIQPAS